MYPCEHCGLPREGKSPFDNSGPHDCIRELQTSNQIALQNQENLAITVRRLSHCVLKYSGGWEPQVVKDASWLLNKLEIQGSPLREWERKETMSARFQEAKNEVNE